jgi:hypothetical protein
MREIWFFSRFWKFMWVFYHVMQIVGSTKALQSIAAFTVERDGDIRKASLAALATAYKILGA